MKFWISCLVAALAFLGLSMSSLNEYLFFAGFVVLQFVVLATAWNILGGYAGYVNFGVPAFVAMGSYTAVVLFKAFHAPLLVQLAGGAITAGLLGLGVGLAKGVLGGHLGVTHHQLMSTLVQQMRHGLSHGTQSNESNLAHAEVTGSFL